MFLRDFYSWNSLKFHEDILIISKIIYIISNYQHL